MVAKCEQKKPLARRMKDNMNIKIVVILNVTLCNLMEVYRRFGDASTRLRGIMSQKRAPREPHICATLQCILRLCRLGLVWLRMGTGTSYCDHISGHFLSSWATIVSSIRALCSTELVIWFRVCKGQQTQRLRVGAHWTQSSVSLSTKHINVLGCVLTWFPFSSTSHYYTFKFLAIVSTIATAVRTSELAATLTSMPSHICQRHFVDLHIQSEMKTKWQDFLRLWGFSFSRSRNPCSYETESFTTVWLYSVHIYWYSKYSFSYCNRLEDFCLYQLKISVHLLINLSMVHTWSLWRPTQFNRCDSICRRECSNLFLHSLLVCLSLMRPFLPKRSGSSYRGGWSQRETVRGIRRRAESA